MPEETKDRITTEDACRDFAKVARLTDENGKTVIYEKGRPKYVVVSAEDGRYLELTDDERFEIVAKRVMRRHKAAFEELAK